MDPIFTFLLGVAYGAAFTWIWMDAERRDEIQRKAVEAARLEDSAKAARLRKVGGSNVLV